MSEIGALSVRIGADTADLTKGLKNAGKEVSGFSASVENLSGKLKAASAVAIGAATAVGVMVKQAINAADEMGKMAAKVGVSTEELSKLSYAADLAGVSTGELQGALGLLTRNMTSAAQGTGDAKNAFDALGIRVKDASGNLRSSADVMGDLADQFANMQDGANKTALAIQIFGRAGANMIPLLNGGRESIKNAGDELERLGGVVTKKAAEEAAQFNDNLTRLNKTVSGLAMQIANSILPRLVDFTNRINTAIQSNLNFYRSLQLIFTTDDQKRIEDLNKKLEELAKSNVSRSIVGRKARQEEIDQIKQEIAERQRLLAERMKEPKLPTSQAPLVKNTEDEIKKKNDLLDEQQQKALGILNEEQRIENERIKMIDDRLLAVQKSLLTEREIVMLSNEERLVALNEARLNERLSEEAFAQAKIDLEQQTQDRLNEIRKRGLNDLEKFTHSSYSKQVKTIVGMMEQMTAGAANQSKAMFNINKAAALANAVMKGYESIQNAYAFGSRFAGPAGGAAMAAIAAVATGAQIRGISSQQFNGGGTVAPSVAASTPAGAVPVADVGGGGGGGGAGQVVTINLTGEIFGREQVRGLIGQINEAISDGAVLRLQ